MAKMTIEEQLANQEFERVLAVKSQESAKQARSNALKTYIKITFTDGDWCFCEPQELSAMTAGSEGYTTAEVQMTEAEFNALPEFQG